MKQFNNETIEKEKAIIDVLTYFSFFNYPPTFEEIYTFLKKKASKRRITAILKNMEKKSLVVSWKGGKGNRSWLRSKKLKKEVGINSNNQFPLPFTLPASNPLFQ